VASRIPTEITAREAELGVISFKPSDPSIKAVPVLIDELVLVVSPKHPFAERQSVSVSDLANETFIAHNAPSPYRKKVIEAFEKHRTRLNISVELPSLEAIKRLVEMGAGIALVPKLTAKAEIATGRLKALSVHDLKLERRLNIVYRKNSVLSHAAQQFLKLAKEVADLK
jgi:DNA-binding transcriptional LysR family regulator